MTTIKLKHGDCLEVLRRAPDNYADSLVTDPPAGIAFMGKEWDEDKGGRDAWVAWMQSVMAECLRVLKPGGHALVWSLPRTSHWTATALENAGFEVRDCVTHLFGTGFPKSLDVSKAIKKDLFHSMADAKRWQGWGTALKPAAEFWWLCRKPLSEKTVAANVLKWGTGALNIDASRIGGVDTRQVTGGAPKGSGWGTAPGAIAGSELGRFPANLILDEEAAKALDEQSGNCASKSGRPGRGVKNIAAVTGFDAKKPAGVEYGDSGGASRFFYVAKASKSDKGADNTHPTVKSTALMAYLVRLVTPPGGIVLDPFMGSGSTGVAAVKDGFGFVGIEQSPEYFAIAERRLSEDEGYGGAA